MSADYSLPPSRRPRAAASALSGGDGGGTIDPMEARVARLEDDMREIKTDLKALREEMRAGFKEISDQFRELRSEITDLRVEVAEIRGRVSQIPNIWHMIALVFTVLGGAFAIARFGIH